jgi:ABC-type multidrug transport system fused ATPase/permease subunit
MKSILKFAKGFKLESVLGPLFKLFEATLELIVPLVIAVIIDKGIGSSDRGYVGKMSLLLVLLGAAGLAFSVTAQYFAAKASVGISTKMRSALFAHLQTLSYTDIDTLGTSTMITRMTSDTNQVQTGINLGLRLLLRSPFVVFGAMIMAFTIDAKSALTFVAVIPALSIVVFGIMLISMPLYKKVQQRVDGVLSKTRENLLGVRVVRAFCTEEKESEEFNRRNNALAASQKYVGRFSALMNPLTYILINLAILWLIYTGAVEVKLGNLTQGQVIALYNYMSQILVELIKLANLIITLTKALASASRIQSVFDIKSEESSGNKTEGIDSDYIIELEEAELKYKNSPEPSLQNLTFKVKKGDTVGIIGGTGSGKTSLVNLICGFYGASGGAVYIDGCDIKTYDSDAVRQKFGIVPQKSVLFSGSIRENLLWGNEAATDEELFAALEIAQAKETVLEKGGLDYMIEEGGANLSGGQKQRLAIARAVVKQPEILILDDSSSALDYATDARLRAALRGMAGERTVIIVSQRTSSIMHADKIIVLDDGEAVGIGTHEELLSNCSVYREIYSSQFKEEVGA